MSEHISSQRLQQYYDCSLPANEFKQTRIHLAACDQCKKEFKQRYNIPGPDGFIGPIIVSQPTDSKHLDWDEDIHPYVDGHLDELGREYVKTHITICPLCAGHVRSLLEFANELKNEGGITRYQIKFGTVWDMITVRRWGYAGLSLVIVGLCIVSVILMRQSRPTEQQAVASAPTQEGVLPVESPPSPSLPRPRSSDKGLARKTPPDRILLAKDISFPSILEVFSGSTVVRSNEVPEESFGIIAPINTLVTYERPSFQWTSLPGAASYEVSLYDDSLSPIETSEPLKQLRWIPSKPLPRGQTYIWRVIAIKDGSPVFAPTPPTVAKFKIIESPELAKLNRRIAKVALPAARGVIYAEAGLLDEAERELSRHMTLHPADRRAKTLLEQVRSWRAKEDHQPGSPTRTNPAQ